MQEERFGMKQAEHETGVDCRTEIGTPVNGMISIELALMPQANISTPGI